MRILLFAAALLAIGPAMAQSPSAPPCAEPVFRQFDFWVGDWEVFGENGAKAGENTISIEESGCLLVEKWRGAGGGTGQSYNFVDLENGKWRQVWVSAGATIDYSGGLDEKGRMVLNGTIGYGAGNPANGAEFRGTWTPEPDGTVIQHFEQKDPSTGEWSDWFRGVYKRKE